MSDRDTENAALGFELFMREHGGNADNGGARLDDASIGALADLIAETRHIFSDQQRALLLTLGVLACQQSTREREAAEMAEFYLSGLAGGGDA